MDGDASEAFGLLLGSVPMSIVQFRYIPAMGVVLEDDFLSRPSISGVAQAGRALEATFAAEPRAAIACQWLGGADEIAGAQSRTCGPTALDGGARVSVRVSSGARSLTHAVVSAKTGSATGAKGHIR